MKTKTLHILIVSDSSAGFSAMEDGDEALYERHRQRRRLTAVRSRCGSTTAKLASWR